MRTYEAVDAGLIRATTIPADVELPDWPDLTGIDVAGWRKWIRQVWCVSGFADAVTVASPELAAEVHRQIATPPPTGVEPRSLRRLVETVARYLLRWKSRATPFGLFAGVAPVELGRHAAMRWGEQHQTVFRLDGESVDLGVQRTEQQLDALRTVEVVTNNLGFARGGAWIVPDVDNGDRLADVEIDLTRPVQLAIEQARQPLVFSDLAAILAAEAPRVDLAVIEAMLAELVERRVLLSAIRPPMTVTDPQARLASYTGFPDSCERRVADTRVDCSVTLPTSVVREAERAASVLTRLAPPVPEPWQSYHQAFIERYGPGAAVPVRELVDGSGLGYPAGYRGSRRRVSPEALTSRDTLLATLAQHAALDGQHEVVLDDELITGLTVGQREPVPHTELRFNIAAPSLNSLQRGGFELSVVSGARHAGVASGRFLHLLTTGEQQRFQHAYQTVPTALPDAMLVQVSGPPLARTMDPVARVPAVLPVLALGEYQPGADIDVDDLAVTGDARQLWLVRRCDGRVVEPMLLNAVDLPDGQQPLARFLTEIPTAFRAPCSPFSWGRAARHLPFLPRIRYGRSILHPAQWTITAAQLPNPAAEVTTWQKAWDRLRETYQLPAAMFLGEDDRQIRLDLNEPAHLALLRNHLHRQPKAILTETGGEARWIGGRAHEVCLTLARTQRSSAGRMRPTRAAGAVEHRPGLSPWLYAQLFGRCDDILARARQLDDLIGKGWWFLRYHEPEPHLRLRIPLRETDRFGPIAEQLGCWAESLASDGLLHDYSLNTYRPEARFGTGASLAAAETVFAADSHLVVRRLSGDREIATAAGLIRIANGFTEDGPAWLTANIDHRGQTPADQRPIGARRKQVLQTLHDLDDDRLQHALVDYRDHAVQDGLDPDHVLADLLHLHHARMIGVDPTSERYCLRLARETTHTLRVQDSA